MPSHSCAVDCNFMLFICFLQQCLLGFSNLHLHGGRSFSFSFLPLFHIPLFILPLLLTPFSFSLLLILFFFSLSSLLPPCLFSYPSSSIPHPLSSSSAFPSMQVAFGSHPLVQPASARLRTAPPVPEPRHLQSATPRPRQPYPFPCPPLSVSILLPLIFLFIPIRNLRTSSFPYFCYTFYRPFLLIFSYPLVAHSFISLSSLYLHFLSSFTSRFYLHSFISCLSLHISTCNLRIPYFPHFR